MPSLQVVKVEAALLSPVQITAELHLDSLLAAVHPAMHHEQKPARCDTHSSNIRVAPLPIAQAKYNGEWVWACSAAQFPDTVIASTSTITRRKDPQDVHETQRVFTPSSGPDKDRMVTSMVLMTPTIYWYAVCRDVSELNRLLRRAKAIGGLRKSGYGTVRSWEVTQIEDPEQAVLVQGGVAMRRLPASYCKMHEAAEILSCKPPYWHHHSDQPVVPPGYRCVLNDGVTIE